MATTKKRIERIVIILSVIGVFALFAYFLSDILVPFLKMNFQNDTEGAKQLLRQKGWLGYLTVVFVEALQMVVVFIPAEFIQISSGLSYPFPLALLFCDLGVCLGASIIFVLVRAFRFENGAYTKTKEKIERLSSVQKKERSVVLFLYFLFFMPIIPFGAICYYGSSTKLRYWKYILTVATGVIPSIVTSNLMGSAAKAFFAHNLPIPLLVLIIVLLAALLFTLIFFFLDRIYFKENKGTPDSIPVLVFYRLVKFLRGKKQKLIADEIPEDVQAPYIVLANHQSFYDFYYITQMKHKRNPAFVVNRYYLGKPFVRSHWKSAGGFIPKRLFTADLSTVRGIVRNVRMGYPVVVFPEGRLSPDGISNPILEGGAALWRKLKTDLVLVRIEGAYFSMPKWRRRFYRSTIQAKVAKVIRHEEFSNYTDAELDDLIEQTLWSDANASTLENRYKQKDKAEGLHNILYRCPNCGGLYTTGSKGNALFCSACGATYELGEDYRFTGAGPRTISEFYASIAAAEERKMQEKPLLLETKVRLRVFDENGHTVCRESGECQLNETAFTYRSEREEFTLPTENLPALPFSCGEEFELYYKNRLYYFYPETNGQQVARWALIVDLLTKQRLQKQKKTEAAQTTGSGK